MLSTAGKRLVQEARQYGLLSSLRRMADSAAPPAKAEDFKWEDVQALVYSPEAKADFTKLHTLVLSAEKQASEDSMKKADVDWALWKKRLDPVMVGKYEAAYKEIAKDELRPETSFDADGWLKTFDSVVDKAKKLEAASEERIKVLEKELVEIQAEMDRMASVTVDEELAANPEMAKEIDEEIAQQNYY